jgi:hypothetical protein
MVTLEIKISIILYSIDFAQLRYHLELYKCWSHQIGILNKILNLAQRECRPKKDCKGIVYKKRFSLFFYISVLFPHGMNLLCNYCNLM